MPLDREKAVAIARDVIKQLESEHSTMSVEARSYYLLSLVKVDLDKIDGDMRDFLPELELNGCTVCAMGASVLSLARLYDNVPIKPFIDYSTHHIVASHTTAFNTLRQVFSEDTIRLMEIAFENNDSDAKAYRFSRKYDNPSDRLKAIMQNIIENNGEFYP